MGLVTLGVASLLLYLWVFSFVGGLDQGTATHVDQVVPAAQTLVPSRYPADADLSAEEKQARHAATVPTWILAFSVLFAVYGVAAWVGRTLQTKKALALVLLFGALFQGLAAIAPFMLSTDVYAYIFYGRIFGVYHGNPYTEVPIQYPGDPYHEYIFWKFAPSFYGPLWTLISGPLAGLADENVGLAVLLFKSVTVASAIGATICVAALLRRVDPALAVTGTLLLAWNPLFVFEAGLGGHNDVAMAFFVALGLALVFWRRPALAIGALVLGGLVKLVAVALIPLVGMFVLRQLPDWRQRGLFVVRAAALSTVLTVAILSAVRAGPETFAVWVLGAEGDRYTNGLGELALGELRVLFGETRDDTEVPLQFKGWWIAAHTATPLRAQRGDGMPILRQVPQWTELLVVGSQYGRWQRVYDPELRQIGYVRANATGPIDSRPPQYDDDPDILAREQGPSGSAALQKANLVVRGVGWGGVALAWSGALIFGTGSRTALLRGSVVVFLVLYYLASGWFWPWYLLWGLVPAAMLPRSWFSLWMVLLSWGSLLLYAALGFADTALWELQTYRSLAVFGLPLVLLLFFAGLACMVAAVRLAFRRAPWLSPTQWRHLLSKGPVTAETRPEGHRAS